MASTDNLAGTPFIKMHGLRNHFVIVDGRNQAFRPSREDIVRICDPAVGVGADELIVIEPSSGPANAFMRIFNIDGREVEACGNATRCVASLLFEESGDDRVIIETLAGQLACHRSAEGQISVAMGKVSTDWHTIPLSGKRDTLHMALVSGDLQDPVVLNIGNPHAVFFVGDLDAIDIVADAPAIQADDLFPESVNVGVAQMLGAGRLRLRVFERGVGLTSACGSGACAAAFAARLRGLTEASDIQVELPGGSVRIEILDDDTVVMTGPVEFNFRGTL